MPELTEDNRFAVRAWLWISVLCLTLSGLAPLLLIAGRASIYAEIGFVKSWFIPMLVLHVNLSVGLWFFALMGLLWSWNRPWASAFTLPLQGGFLLGMACLALAPLGGGEAYTSNYIPVQNNLIFFIGLGLVFATIGLSALENLWLTRLETMQELISLTISAAALIALCCFTWSAMQHPPGYGGEAYYEAIFWGGGHVLQNAYVLIALFAWLTLAAATQVKLPPKSLTLGCVLLLLVTILGSPLAYSYYTVTEYNHIRFFTHQMMFLTGPLSGLVMLWLLANGLVSLRKLKFNALTDAFFASLLLFALGGIVSGHIQGSDVTIPAHYHGSTGGVTLAAMGLIFYLLPRLGYADVSHWKLARLQPWIYSLGQLLFVIGFTWAGGYDVARKTAGALDASQQGAKLALQIYRFGGLLAVVGGALFIIVVIRAYRKRPATPLPAQTS